MGSQDNYYKSGSQQNNSSDAKFQCRHTKIKILIIKVRLPIYVRFTNLK